MAAFLERETMPWTFFFSIHEKNSSSLTGAQEIDTSDLSSFTEFADLKESDVTGWVETSLSTDEINSYSCNCPNGFNGTNCNNGKTSSYLL